MFFSFICAHMNAQEETIKIGNTEWAACNLGAEKQTDYGSFLT